MTMTEQEKFNKLVECAEKFIVYNAEPILKIIRIANDKKADININELKEPQNDNEISIRCKKLIKDIYKPKFKFEDNKIVSNDNSKIELTIDDIIMRFCQELQNYQAMPQAINYISYSYNPKECPDKYGNMTLDGNSEHNTIFECVKEFYEKNKGKKDDYIKQLNDYIQGKKNNTYNNDDNASKNGIPPSYNYDLYKFLQEKVGFDENSELSIENYNQISNMKEDIQFEEKKYTRGKNVGHLKCYKYNYAWYRYSRGLMDVLIKIYMSDNEECYVKELIEKCRILDNSDKKNEFEECINNFNENIYYLGDTLTFDFFKELACENLVKADVHIKEIFKKFKLSKITSENSIAKDFINKCENYRTNYKKDNHRIYVPYYIDKLFWLCCTGQFYEDGIIINKMTRTNFFKFVEAEYPDIINQN